MALQRQAAPTLSSISTIIIRLFSFRHGVGGARGVVGGGFLQCRLYDPADEDDKIKERRVGGWDKNFIM